MECNFLNFFFLEVVSSNQQSYEDANHTSGMFLIFVVKNT